MPQNHVSDLWVTLKNTVYGGNINISGEDETNATLMTVRLQHPAVHIVNKHCIIDNDAAL